jgi:hypothetical protein
MSQLTGPAFSQVSGRGTESLQHGIKPKVPVNITQNSHLTPVLPLNTPAGPVGDVRQPGHGFRKVNKSYRPEIQAIGGLSDRPGGIITRNYAHNIPVPTKAPHNEAWNSYQAGERRRNTYQLEVTWKQFLKNFPSESKISPESIGRARLDEICNRTDTFLSTPAEESVLIEIWGTQEDTERAKAELQVFEADVRQAKIRPSRQNWQKLQAHDGRSEDRTLRQLREQELMKARLEINRERRFECEAHLLWPPDVDMNSFRAAYEDNTLHEIQGASDCRIDFIGYKEPKSVRISAQDERDVLRIYGRLINLIKEAVAQSDLLLHINCLHLPDPSRYRDKVGLDLDAGSQLFLPTLHGAQIKPEEIPPWQDLRQQMDLKNRIILKRAMNSIIKAIQAPGQHVRMRAVFTELGFRQFERPPAGQDAHTFDEFSGMLSKPLAEVDMAGLRDQANNLGRLAEKLAAHPDFEPHQTRYSLTFDFGGTQNSTLRFEREMYVGAIGELEIDANRWLQFSSERSKNEVLICNVLDFEHLNANYQVRIGKVDVRESVPQKLAIFEHTVSFTPDEDGIQTVEPKRRAILPPGHTNLRSHIETTIERFRYKQGDGYFELIRKDVFDNSQARSSPTSTSWSAQFYYPEWDALLGEFANLKAGDQVSWRRDMDTFFRPKDAVHDHRPLPEGFGGFVDDIEDIQQVLQNAIAELHKEAGISG